MSTSIGEDGVVAERWYKEAVIYCLDVKTFMDSDGDGIGDFRGLTSRLDYLARLGVTCLWLNPIHPSPDLDDGYDVSEYYGIDARLGSLGDFVDFMHEADTRGLRVIIDLVVNHTSTAHSWFQAARSDPKSKYRDFYVWSRARPANVSEGVVFPGVQERTWTYDRAARAWYFHRFYDFEPDLNIANPAVREEICRIMGFWLQLGVSGFRMDAAPFVIDLTGIANPDTDNPFAYLRELRDFLSWRRGDALVLAEANVSEDELLDYFGDGDRLHMLFNFGLNQRTFLALARSNAAPIVDFLQHAPALPTTGQWATFLRNHDELDLSRLRDSERQEVFTAFAPDPSMQLYGRGIRRRLAPMLGNDRRHIELAYSLQFTLPGTPVLRYGEEIGMGEDLSLPERNAIRTPMQWSASRNGGFSTAKATALYRPVITKGDCGFRKVNVASQRLDGASLLSWMERMLRTLRECPEFGTGVPSLVDTGQSSVIVMRYEGPTGEVMALHNLTHTPCTIDIDTHGAGSGAPLEMFSDDTYDAVGADLQGMALNGYGYRWLRLRGNHAV